MKELPQYDEGHFEKPTGMMLLILNGERLKGFPLKSEIREFPDGPVVRTLCFHCQWPGFNPWSGN